MFIRLFFICILLYIQGATETMNHFNLRAIFEHSFLESWCCYQCVVQFKALPVSMECWSNEHRVFVIEMFFKSGDSVVRMQHLFWQHFDVGQNDKVPSRKSITRCVQQFRATASATNKNPPGRPCTVHIPDNIARVTTALKCSPVRSVRRHSQVLNILDRSVRRMLYLDMKFHPYKLQVVQ